MKSLRRVLPQSLGTVHYLAAAVLLLRLIVLVQLAGSSALLPAGGDMQFYHDWAVRITGGTWTDGYAFYGLPLYPYVVALLYSIVGENPFVAVLPQVLLDTGTAVILYQLALRVFPGTTAPERQRAQIVGIAAALAWALYVPAQAFAVILMPTAWLTFSFWFVVWRTTRRDGPPGAAESLLLGLLIGLTAMAVATILFLIPLILMALLLKIARAAAHFSAAKRAAAALLLALGLLLGTSPAWLHNTFVARDPVLLSAHSGVNFWIGNNPDATGYPTFPSGLRAGQAAMLQDSIRLAEEAAGRPLPRSEVSAFWKEKARSYIREQPAAWARLLLAKAANYWNAFQYDDVGIITRLADEGVTLPGFRFGLIAALALAGLFYGWRSAPRSRWIALAVALQMLSLLPVFITERYRLAAAPGLILLALIGLSYFWQTLIAQRFGHAASYAGALLLATWFVSLPRTAPSLWALDAYNSGRLALAANDLPVAEEKLNRAAAYVPDNPEVHLALGNLHLAREDLDRAEQHYRTTLRSDPRHKSAISNLGLVALTKREPDRAAALFRQALTLAPGDAKTHYLLARAELQRGEIETARSEIAHALRLNPTQPEFLALQAELERHDTPAP